MIFSTGVYVIGFSYPVVPKGKARIRVQISAAHSDEDIDHTVDSFIKTGRKHGVISWNGQISGHRKGFSNLKKCIKNLEASFKIALADHAACYWRLMNGDVGNMSYISRSMEVIVIFVLALLNKALLLLCACCILRQKGLLIPCFFSINGGNNVSMESLNQQI